MDKRPKLTIKGSFTQRQPDGNLVGLEFHGEVDVVHKPVHDPSDKHHVPEDEDMKKVYEVVLEGEMHGNAGKTRVHIFLQ